MGYSPWGRKKTQLSVHSHTHTHTHTEDMKIVMALLFCTSFVLARKQEDFMEEVAQGSKCLCHAHTKAPTLGLAPAGQSGIETPICLCVCVQSLSSV